MLRDFWLGGGKGAPKGLPPGLGWARLTPNDAPEISEFLANNYVRDPSNTFAIAYSTEFVRWLLDDPGALPPMQLGIRHTTTNQLIATVCGTAMTTRQGPMGFGNLLCVHRDHRKSGLVVHLAHAIVGAGHACGLFCALFTTGNVLRGVDPIARTTSWNRILDPVAVHHSKLRTLKPRETISRVMRLFHVPDTMPSGWRPMEEGDLPRAVSWINAGDGVRRLYTIDEARHRFMCRDDIVCSFVCDSGFGGFVITGLRANGNDLFIACAPVVAPFSRDILAALLWEAQQQDCSMFVAYEAGPFTQNVLTDLKFEKGNTLLNYHSYGDDTAVRAALAPGIGAVGLDSF